MPYFHQKHICQDRQFGLPPDVLEPASLILLNASKLILRARFAGVLVIHVQQCKDKPSRTIGAYTIDMASHSRIHLPAHG
jgi:nicotinamidase-related amidase